MDNPNDITVLSLCTGYGGLELGLHRALGRPLRVVAVEIEAFAAANLVAKAEEGKLAIEALYPDLKTFPAERFSGCFDFILAGYPCQPFSVAGKRKGTDDPRHLWPYIRQHIAAIRPLFVFCENVGGHLQMGFDEVYRSLAGMGYSVEAGLFTAAECGAPHKRERLFMLAHAQSQRCREAGPDCQRPTERPASTNTVADATKLRMERRRETGDVIISKNGGEALSCNGCERTRWPAGPRQEQYDWECPRTVADNNSGRGGGKQRYSEGVSGIGNNSEQAKPRLGRAVNGPQSRVDRLRLLGNGVVPAQAELAFRTLWEKMGKCLT